MWNRIVILVKSNIIEELNDIFTIDKLWPSKFRLFYKFLV